MKRHHKAAGRIRETGLKEPPFGPSRLKTGTTQFDVFNQNIGLAIRVILAALWRWFDPFVLAVGADVLFICRVECGGDGRVPFVNSVRTKYREISV
jgi:hypothetical protein